MLEALTPREVASALHVHIATVNREIARGRLPAVKFGRTTRIRRDDLDRYLADNPRPIAEPPASWTQERYDAARRLLERFPPPPLDQAQARAIADVYRSHALDASPNAHRDRANPAPATTTRPAAEHGESS